MIKLAISGCLGRMGQRITDLAFTDKDFQVAVLLERADHPEGHHLIHNLSINTDPSALKGADVLIEFTSPSATREHLENCLRYKVKMVVGTTGLSPDEIGQIRKASQKIPIVFSSNMSVGVNVLFKLTREAAPKLGEDYQVKIIEAHHVHKKDAPSGTAKTLAQIIEGASQRRVTDIQSIREGEIIGDHKVIFESGVDTITISHQAKTRDIFAKGALVAAKFVAKKKKGLYSMQDVLDIV